MSFRLPSHRIVFRSKQSSEVHAADVLFSRRPDSSVTVIIQLAINPVLFLLISDGRFVQEFYPMEIPVIDKPPTSFEFLKDYVSVNRPVLIKNAVTHFPACKKWTNDYLRSALQHKNLTVAVTPNGYADAIYNSDFLMPEERFMSFDGFLDTLENPQPHAVFYIQKQDNNFSKEFYSLMPDIEKEIPWATEAFGYEPDAVNFWMGDSRAVTSLHKDHYENIYCVIRGKKDFILHAPVDAPWIPYGKYRVGRYTDVGGNTPVVQHLGCETKWIPVNPLDPQPEYPLYKRARKYHLTVEEGDAFYLPSLWFHHVLQSHGCIAVNYWYDMNFASNYCHFKFLEDIGELIHTNINPDVQEEMEDHGLIPDFGLIPDLGLISDHELISDHGSFSDPGSF